MPDNGLAEFGTRKLKITTYTFSFISLNNKSIRARECMSLKCFPNLFIFQTHFSLVFLNHHYLLLIVLQKPFAYFSVSKIDSSKYFSHYTSCDISIMHMLAYHVHIQVTFYEPLTWFISPVIKHPLFDLYTKSSKSFLLFLLECKFHES